MFLLVWDHFHIICIPHKAVWDIINVFIFTHSMDMGEKNIPRTRETQRDLLDKEMEKSQSSWSVA